MMKVNRSGYYRYLVDTASARKEGDLRLQIEIKALFNQSLHCYGSRRISKALKAKGYPVGRYKARSIKQSPL